MSKKLLRVALAIALASVIALNLVPSISKAQSPVTIHIFVGLGAGTQPGQIEAENALAKKWNDANTDIKIQFDIVANAQARDALLTQAAGDNPPDIVGPAGLQGLFASKDLWADLSGMIKDNKVDLSDIDKASISYYQLGDKQIAIPLGIYPSFLFVNEDAFKAAGVDLPPTKYGEKGVATYAGKPWDMAALRDVAIKVTQDKSGKFGNEDGFDPKNVAVYGYADQWSDLRGIASHWAPEDVVKDGKPNFSQQAYVDALTWYNDSIWKDHFQPNNDQRTALQPNDFASGSVAMVYAPTWFSWWTPVKFNWSIAVAPAAPNGKLVSRLNADTFAILDKSKHKAEAFKVLTWLTGEGVGDVCAIYGCMPARTAGRAAWEATTKKNLPQFNFDIIYGAIPYADAPNYQSDMPNYSKSFDTYQALYNKLFASGLTDVAGDLKALDASLTSVWAEKK